MGTVIQFPTRSRIENKLDSALDTDHELAINLWEQVMSGNRLSAEGLRLQQEITYRASRLSAA